MTKKNTIKQSGKTFSFCDTTSRIPDYVDSACTDIQYKLTKRGTPYTRANIYIEAMRKGFKVWKGASL